MNLSHLWPENYNSSREGFINAAHVSKEITAKGADGGALTIDLAACISDSDQHRIVITSGLHGVEGFIGAAIQHHVLRIMAEEGLPENVGVVLIHAVNPWGYSHLRRVDEHNVDLNRNFIDYDRIDFDSLISNSEAYEALNPIINAQTIPSFSDDIRYGLNAAQLIAKNRGIETLAGPIAEGQYRFPKGLFYGGQSASESRVQLETWVSDYSHAIPNITLLDIHSGLGPSGYATLIANTNQVPLDQSADWLQPHFGMPVVPHRSDNNAYNANGSFSQWCDQSLSNQRFTFLCVEIGTVNPLKVLNSLRRENQAHHWANSNSSIYDETKLNLLTTFNPDSKRWRERAIGQGIEAYRKSLLFNRG